MILSTVFHPTNTGNNGCTSGWLIKPLVLIQPSHDLIWFISGSGLLFIYNTYQQSTQKTMQSQQNPHDIESEIVPIISLQNNRKALSYDIKT